MICHPVSTALAVYSPSKCRPIDSLTGSLQAWSDRPRPQCGIERYSQHSEQVVRTSWVRPNPATPMGQPSAPAFSHYYTAGYTGANERLVELLMCFTLRPVQLDAPHKQAARGRDNCYCHNDSQHLDGTSNFWSRVLYASGTLGGSWYLSLAFEPGSASTLNPP
jgi:hypothetical protein